MTERSYTVSEIDNMRDAMVLHMQALWKRDFKDARIVPSDPTAPMRLLEERLRTYMLAGCDPGDVVNRMIAETYKITKALTDAA